MAAVNSEKWADAAAEVESPSSCLTGDSLPGGDTCDADGCTKRGTGQGIPPDFSGVEKVSSSSKQLFILIH